MTEILTKQSHEPSCKPYIPQTITISPYSQATFPSKCYKYIHRLDFTYDKKFIERTISRLKYLQYFHLSTMTNPCLMQKLVKPYRKYLTSISNQLTRPEIQKLLPRLDDLTVVSDDPSDWKILISRSAFQRLSFYLEASNTNHVLKYRSALSRNFPKMKQLTSLNIEATLNETDLVLPILEIVNSKATLNSLKEFHLTILARNSPFNPKTSPKIKKTVECITELSVNSPEWYALLLSAGSFTNLTSLHLNISPKDSWDFGNLSRFKDFLKLKKLNFSFTANSIACEREFFENFTAAPALEYLNFTMNGFCWKDAPLTKNNRKVIQNSFLTEAPYIHFFERLEDWKNLKVLALTINNGPLVKNCPRIAGKFASLFMRRLTNLERVNFSYPPARPDDDSWWDEENQEEEEEEFPKKPLKIKDFWKGLEQSKETLQNVSIRSPEMAFPVDIEVLETNFPRLNTFIVELSVVYARKLGSFWRKIWSFKHVHVQDLAFNDEKELKEFLDDVQEIPEEMDVTLYLNVGNIKQEFLIDCLRKFIEEVKVRGNFGLYFRNVEARDRKSYVEILQLAVNKGSFRTFKMDLKSTSVLLHVVKKDIFAMSEDLASEYAELNSK